jgi:nucleoside-diphosphate-sugar epimerase
MSASSGLWLKRYHTGCDPQYNKGQMMRVVITGGAGFLGSRLARKILERGTLVGTDGTQHVVHELVLFDVALAAGFSDPRVTVVAGDVSDPEVVRELIGGDTQSVFHLAAVVSGQAEA